MTNDFNIFSSRETYSHFFFFFFYLILLIFATEMRFSFIYLIFYIHDFTLLRFPYIVGSEKIIQEITDMIYMQKTALIALRSSDVSSSQHILLCYLYVLVLPVTFTFFSNYSGSAALTLP